MAKYTQDQIDNAMACARLLIIAYAKGEARGGTMEWSDVDDAYEKALEADSNFYIEALADAEKEQGEA